MNKLLEWPYLLLVFSLAFMQPNIEVGGLNLQPTEPLFILTVFIAAVLFLRKPRSLILDKTFIWFALYFLALVASAILSLDVWLSSGKLIGVLYLIGLAILTANVVQTSDTFNRVAQAWLIGSTVASLIGVATVLFFYFDRSNSWIVYFLHHYGSLPAGNYPRIQSTFIYPAMLCNYLTVGLLFTLALERSGRIQMSLFAIALCSHVLTALFTLTPGLGGVALGICLWYGWVFIKRDQVRNGRLIIFAGGAVALLSIIVSAFSAWPIGSSPYHFDVAGFRVDPTQRLLAWSDAVATFCNYPFFGKGIGLAAANVIFQPPSGPIQLLTDAHNTWLNIAAQAGTVGLVSIIGLSIVVIKAGIRASLYTNSAFPRALLIAFISAFVVQGFVGSFEDARHLWVLIGLLTAAERIEANASP